MNESYLQSPEHFRWPTLLVSLVAGLWCASGVSGHADAAAMIVIEDSVAETSSVNVETELVINQQLEPAEDQVIITRKSCHALVPVQVSARDEVWLVSARGSECFPCELSQLSCCLLQNGSWQDSSLNELVARHSSDKSRATMVYVHGNRTDLGFAKARGLQVYQTAFQDSPCVRPPIRFVLFVWKSEKEIRRPVTDFGIKSDRAVMVGKTFSRFLGQFEDRNLAILGFSLGSQVTLSALTCADAEAQDNRSGKYRVGLIAPALDPEFVRAKLRSVPNNSLVEQTRVFRNRDDRVIKAAQFIVRRRSRASITTLRQLACLSKVSLNPISVLDITCEISKKHSITNYCVSPTIRAGLAQMLNDVFSSEAFPIQLESPLTSPAPESVVVPAN